VFLCFQVAAIIAGKASPVKFIGYRVVARLFKPLGIEGGEVEGNFGLFFSVGGGGAFEDIDWLENTFRIGVVVPSKT